MPDIPQEAVRLAAEVRLRQYGSEYSSAHLTWRDFADEVTEVLETAAEALRSVALAAIAKPGGRVSPEGWQPRLIAVLALAPDGLPTPEVARRAGHPSSNKCHQSLCWLERKGIVRRAGTVKLAGGRPSIVWTLTEGATDG